MSIKVGDLVPVSIPNIGEFKESDLPPVVPPDMVFTVSNVGNDVYVLYADTFDCKQFSVMGVSGDVDKCPIIGITPEGINEGEYRFTWLRFDHPALLKFDVIATSASKYMAIVVLGIMSFQEEWKKDE